MFPWLVCGSIISGDSSSGYNPSPSLALYLKIMVILQYFLLAGDWISTIYLMRKNSETELLLG